MTMTLHVSNTDLDKMFREKLRVVKIDESLAHQADARVRGYNICGLYVGTQYYRLVSDEVIDVAHSPDVLMHYMKQFLQFHATEFLPLDTAAFDLLAIAPRILTVHAIDTFIVRRASLLRFATGKMVQAVKGKTPVLHQVFDDLSEEHAQFIQDLMQLRGVAPEQYDIDSRDYREFMLKYKHMIQGI